MRRSKLLKITKKLHWRPELDLTFNEKEEKIEIKKEEGNIGGKDNKWESKEWI